MWGGGSGGQRGRGVEGLELESGGGDGGVGDLAWVPSTYVETVSVSNVVQPECLYTAMIPGAMLFGSILHAGGH